MTTFRELRLLQTREIGPDDYDLLMRLGRKSTTKVLGEQQLAAISTVFRASAPAGETCAVCLCAMAEGEELCQLACQGGHTFHRHCISEWLRTASRCCPVDQQDLSACCLSA